MDQCSHTHKPERSGCIPDILQLLGTSVRRKHGQKPLENQPAQTVSEPQISVVESFVNTQITHTHSLVCRVRLGTSGGSRKIQFLPLCGSSVSEDENFGFYSIILGGEEAESSSSSSSSRQLNPGRRLPVSPGSAAGSAPFVSSSQVMPVFTEITFHANPQTF